MPNTTIKKIRDKSAVVGVVGLGYVGLPLAVEIAKAGLQVVGIDISQEKIDMVMRAENYIGDVQDADLAEVVQQGKLQSTTDFSQAGRCDCVCIAVPTPLDMYQQPDISFVTTSAKSILPYVHKDMLIILESTTYPGTTEELLLPMFQREDFICGQDFYLAFSPERVDPGNAKYKTKNTPKVVGGVTPVCTETAAALYETVLDAEVFQASSPAVAEMEKILENTYRNINIGMINEMAMLCHKMKIDIWEVIEAAKTKPYGFQAFYPGPGLGGHCIPLDPYYLSWKAREYGFHTSMIESSMMINDRMPSYCVDRIMHLLNQRKKALNGAKVLVLGVAYKQDIDDCRESPAIHVMEELEKRSADICYFDPYVHSFVFNGKTIFSEPALTEALVRDADLVIVTAAHTTVDYDLVARHADLVFDTKNAMNKVQSRENIYLL